MDNNIRFIALAGATGKSRMIKHDGREHLVVPVVALVEGVIHPVNAPTRELVRADLFPKTLAAWNGRPLFAGHPMRNGTPVSGNTPDMLETCLGRIFNPRVEGKRLLMEAWLDPERCATTNSGQRLLERAKANELIEVSVGVFVDAVPTVGDWNGRGYSAEWASMTPDHLALLSEGQVGACSAAMGCGIRAAQEAEEFDDDFRALWPDKSGKDSHGRDGSATGWQGHGGEGGHAAYSVQDHTGKNVSHHTDYEEAKRAAREHSRKTDTHTMVWDNAQNKQKSVHHHTDKEDSQSKGFGGHGETHHEAPGGWKGKISKGADGKIRMEVHNPQGAHIGSRGYPSEGHAREHLEKMSKSHLEVGKFVGHPGWRDHKGKGSNMRGAEDEEFRAAWPDKSGKDDHGRPEGGVHGYTHPVHGKTEVDYGKPGEMSAGDIIATHVSMKKQGYKLDAKPKADSAKPSKKAVNDVNTAATPNSGGKVRRKFKQDDREAAQKHYDDVRKELASQGFTLQKKEKGSQWEGEFWHHPTKGHVAVDKSYLGVIPGDYAKGHRGVHEVAVRGGRFLTAAEEWDDEMRAAEEVIVEKPGLVSRILSALFGSVAEAEDDLDEDDLEDFRAAWPNRMGEDDHGREPGGGHPIHPVQELHKQDLRHPGEYEDDPEAFKPGEKPKVGDRVTFTKGTGSLLGVKKGMHGTVKRVSTNKNTIGHHIIVVRPDHPGRGMAPDDERVSAHWLKRFKLKAASASEEEEEFRAAWPDKHGRDDHGRGLDPGHIGEGHVESSEQYGGGVAAHMLGIRVPGHKAVHTYRRAGSDWEHEELGPVKDKDLKWMLNRASEMVVTDDRTHRKLKMLEGSEELELRAACGCGGTCEECTHDDDAAIAAQGEDDMERKQRIAALAANPHSTVKSVKALELLTDEELDAAEKATKEAAEGTTDLKAAQSRITALEAAAEALKTEEGFLAAAPQSVRDIVNGTKAVTAARVDTLVGQLKVAQSAFTEEELKAKPIAELEKLATISKIEAPADYSGRGFPRFAQESSASFAPPDPYAEGLKALQASGK